MIKIKRIEKDRPGVWILVESDRFYEAEMRRLQLWCTQHRCGKRMAFDMFRFRDESELSMFMLRWCQ